MGGAATPEDPRGEDEGRSCQVQHRPWRSWQLVYSSPRGISQGLLQLFRQQWQRTKWILRPLEPHPRAPLEHLFFTAQYRNIRKKRQAYASSSSSSTRRSSLIMVSALDIALGFGFAERKTKKAWDLRTEDILAGMTPDVINTLRFRHNTVIYKIRFLPIYKLILKF